MAKALTEKEFQDRLVGQSEYFPFGGYQCAGCGSFLGSRLTSNILKKYDNLLVSGGSSCGFGFLGLRRQTTGEGGGGSIMGMWGASLIGLLEALEARGLKNLKVFQVGGDGSTTGMGLGTTLHAFMRGGPFTLLICRNEYYAQSGYHLCGMSPLLASDRVLTTGKKTPPNPTPYMVAMAGAKYAATATVGHAVDMANKIDMALEHQPSFIDLLCPCVTGWRYPTAMTIEMCDLAVKTGMYPLWEWLQDGEEVYFRQTLPVPEPRVPVTEYTRHQRRFQHLTEADVVTINTYIDGEMERVHNLEASYPYKG